MDTCLYSAFPMAERESRVQRRTVTFVMMYSRLLTTLLTLFITSLPTLKLLRAQLACAEYFLWLTRTRGQQAECKRSRLTLCSPCSGIGGVLIHYWDEPPSSSGHFFFFPFLLSSVVRSKMESPANRRGRPPSDIRRILRVSTGWMTC